MNIAICDDEQLEREQLKQYIQTYSVEKIDARVDLFDSGEDLVLAYRNGSVYDIVFLDILMKKINGIETAQTIHYMIPNAIIIFISSYVTYVSEAFRLNAFQFLIKPVYREVFNKEFKRVLNQHYSQHRKYLIRSKSSQVALNYKDIVYIESYQRHLSVVTKDGLRYTDFGKLGDRECQMRALGFVRIHQGFLLNQDYIKCINDKDILTTNGMLVPMSSRKKSYVLNQFNKYMMGKIL